MVVLLCWPYVHAVPKHSSQMMDSKSDRTRRETDCTGTGYTRTKDCSPKRRGMCESCMFDLCHKGYPITSSTYGPSTFARTVCPSTTLKITSTFTTTVQASCSATPAIAGALNSTLVPVITGLITITVVVAVLVATLILVCLYVRQKTQLQGTLACSA